MHFILIAKKPPKKNDLIATFLYKEWSNGSTNLSSFLGRSISSVLPLAPKTVRYILVSVPAY